ncbi:high choriolytic enzyme 1-like isoform X1 [Xiphophorus hellerii]|uniref:high choriolytic enzyme 1-like isoform X1 n=1 Tax=Xiphophorus hellerii TaxID=8084 RepID=UPI0013B41392|nr:high choriolytic enzyme 1-like isoform X1 [Xiphophorus hellerii]
MSPEAHPVSAAFKRWEAELLLHPASDSWTNRFGFFRSETSLQRKSKMIAIFFFFLAIPMAEMAVIPLTAVGSVNQINKTMDVTDAIAKANAGIKTPLIYGDIAPSKNRNAVPCTATGCTWPKTGSYVYIPVDISPAYSLAERNIIINGLVSFHTSTCIRFVWRNSAHRDYIYFYPGTGCWSYLGRQGGLQQVSLQKNGCMYHSTVQHEVNHALGFHHEQVRSDRDSYVQVLTQNIIPGQEHNFVKIQTNNLGTPYDFNSVMHYHKFSFSRNGLPTLLSKTNPSLDFGRATSMSANDITRINRLYRC